MALCIVAALVACRSPGPRIPPRQIVAAAGVVQPGEPWAPAYRRLVDRLGEPTRIEGATYFWASQLGDDCYLIEVRTEAGRVAYVDDPMRPPPVEHRNPFRRCAWAAAD